MQVVFKDLFPTLFFRDRFRLYVARSGTKLEKTSLSPDGNIRPLQIIQETNFIQDIE